MHSAALSDGEQRARDYIADAILSKRNEARAHRRPCIQSNHLLIVRPIPTGSARDIGIDTGAYVYFIKKARARAR